MSEKKEINTKKIKGWLSRHRGELILAVGYFISGISIGVSIGHRKGLNTAVEWLDAMDSLHFVKDNNEKIFVSGKEFLDAACERYIMKLIKEK